jgi:pimeloyl-ACP methyl ester carboxylesterase
MAAFVLVHGSGRGGWCWRFIEPLLRAAGHDVYAPTLSGLGASSHLFHELNQISLDIHVKDATKCYSMSLLIITIYSTELLFPRLLSHSNHHSIKEA